MGCGRSRVAGDEVSDYKRQLTGSSEGGSVGPRQAWVPEKLRSMPLLTPLLQPMGAMRGRIKTTAVQRIEMQSQTESEFNEDEFDWDLSDHTDVETQTYRLPHQLSADISVQTDVRFTQIMHSGTGSGAGGTRAGRKTTRTASTQTIVVRVNKVTQTEPLQPTPASRTVTRHGSPVPSELSMAALNEGRRSICTDPLSTKERSNLAVLHDFESQVNMAMENCTVSECQTNTERDVISPALGLHHSFPKSLDIDDATSLQELLARSPRPRRLRRKDASVQTDNDFLTDEAPEFAAVPPACKKPELITNDALFDDVDDWVLATPETETVNLTRLAAHLTAVCNGDDLRKARAVFFWIVNNIRFDWSLLDSSMDADDVLQRRAGVCREYVLLFSALCEKIGVRSKRLHGFAKNHDYKPGHHFRPNEDATHAWNAVFVRGSWRLVDCTWGAGYTDTAGQFVQRINEFYFLVDPEDLTWTHFPYDEAERAYERWQLQVQPQNLEQFNKLPKVTPWFFINELRLKRVYECPVAFKHQTEIEIFCHGPVMRFKYKFYGVSEVESSELNGYVFCQLRGKDRRLGSFTVQPPEQGSYFLKIYGRPEDDILDEESLPLDHLATFLLHCLKPRRQFSAWPVSDIPWGPTGFLYEMGASLYNQDGPVIVTWGGFKQLVLEVKVDLLTMVQVFDVDGLEVEAKTIVKRKDVDGDIIFFIHPPRIGFYKLLLYGMPRPTEKGKWRLPLLASFLIDSKLSRTEGDVVKEDTGESRKKIRLKPRAR